MWRPLHVVTGSYQSGAGAYKSIAYQINIPQPAAALLLSVGCVSNGATDYSANCEIRIYTGRVGADNSWVTNATFQGNPVWVGRVGEQVEIPWMRDDIVIAVAFVPLAFDGNSQTFPAGMYLSFTLIPANEA